MANESQDAPRKDEATDTEFVGHEWDGIEELDTPMPRWWLWTFYATIVWGLAYTVAYPAWPMINRATEGVLEWSSRGQLAERIEVAELARADVRAQIAATPLESLPDDPALLAQAVAGGRAAYQVNCIQCHGSGAAGSQQLGYPNLNDDDWLWGGDIRAIEYTLVHGIRQQGDPETRQSMMPAYEGILTTAQTGAVADHVLSLSGLAEPSAEGAQIYEQNCALCHGLDGRGDRDLGAPNLADAVWLRGSSRQAVTQQILNPRMGMMPSWEGRLDPVTIKMLAAYVHSLGGGEELVELAADPEVEVDEQP